MAYEVTDRRPIAARRLGVVQAAARRLAAAGVSANAISLLGMLLAAITAAALTPGMAGCSIASIRSCS